MKTRTCWTVALAAGIWGSIGEPAASPEYRKDPAVRAAIEQKLKTSDEAEIRRRWGAFTHLVDQVWIHQRQGTETRTWFHLRWLVPGAVMEYALGHCPATTCSVRKAVLVHRPAPAPSAVEPPASSSEAFSLSGLTRALSSLTTSLVNPDAGRPTFDVLWEDGADAVGAVLESGVKMDGYEYEYEASKAEVSVRGTLYKATTPAALAAATGYALPGVTATKPATEVKASQPLTPPAANTPLRTAEYRKDPVVRAAVEEKLKTSDEAEIRRRWGPLADFVGRPWMQHHPTSGTGNWFYPRWRVHGAVMDFSIAWCRSRKCDVWNAVLVHNPEASSTWSLSNVLRQPAFDALWDNSRADELGLVLGEGAYVRVGPYNFRFVADPPEARVEGVPYKPATAAAIAEATGYVLPGAPVLAKTDPPAIKEDAKAGEQKAMKSAAPVIAPVVAKGTVRGGLLGAEIAANDPARPHEGPQLLKAVMPDGPAAGAGLAAGDLIESIGGIERPTQGDVLRTILAGAGKVVPIVVLRNGQSIARSVKLGERTLAGPCFVVGLGADYQYDGECKDGFAHGRGELSYSIQVAGKPTLTRYSGEFQRGYMEGRGTIATATVTYEGELAGHQRHGRGKLTYADGRPGFEGQFAHNEAVGLKTFPEAVTVCTRPDAAGKFECDTPQRTGVAGGPGAKGRPESPQALLANSASTCPSQRRLASRTHLVWGCGFGATNAPGAIDRGAGVEMRGRGAYHCTEREAGCKRTEPI